MSYRNPVRTVKAEALTVVSPVRVSGQTSRSFGGLGATLQLPQTARVGQLVVMAVALNQGSNAAMTASWDDFFGGGSLPAWTKVYRFDSGSYAGDIFSLNVFTSTVPADTSLSARVSTTGSGSGLQGSMSLLTCSGASTLSVTGQGYNLDTGTVATPAMGTGVCSSGAALLAFISAGTSLASTSMGWGNALQGGPPAGQAWSSAGQVNPNGGSLLTSFGVANWTPDAEYNAVATMGNPRGFAALLRAA